MRPGRLFLGEGYHVVVGLVLFDQPDGGLLVLANVESIVAVVFPFGLDLAEMARVDLNNDDLIIDDVDL